MATKTKKPKMKRGRNPENTADLIAVLRAFGPTRNLLKKATREYLKDFPQRKRKAKTDSFTSIPPVQ